MEVSDSRIAVDADRTHAKGQVCGPKLARSVAQDTGHNRLLARGERGRSRVIAVLPGQQEGLDARGHRRVRLSDTRNSGDYHHNRGTYQRSDPDHGAPRLEGPLLRSTGRSWQPRSPLRPEPPGSDPRSPGASRRRAGLTRCRFAGGRNRGIPAGLVLSASCVVGVRGRRWPASFSGWGRRRTGPCGRGPIRAGPTCLDRDWAGPNRA